MENFFQEPRKKVSRFVSFRKFFYPGKHGLNEPFEKCLRGSLPELSVGGT
ncbi:hypothetical protein EVA_12508 [gut metagenome]|uniref:Uncharacterized protein n=1 Tax=gut metagenome TaxID=749906 RepID=J9CH40_9ZZZZ